MTQHKVDAVLIDEETLDLHELATACAVPPTLGRRARRSRLAGMQHLWRQDAICQRPSGARAPHGDDRAPLRRQPGGCSAGCRPDRGSRAVAKTVAGDRQAARLTSNLIQHEARRQICNRSRGRPARWAAEHFARVADRAENRMDQRRVRRRAARDRSRLIRPCALVTPTGRHRSVGRVRQDTARTLRVGAGAQSERVRNARSSVAPI